VGRTQWKLFAIAMTGMFTTGPFCLPFAKEHPWLVAVPVSFLLLTFGTVLYATLVSPLRDLWNRKRGVAVVGRVIHARSSGYTNHVPTWEVEAMLPGGATTHLLVTRFRPFLPDEPISLVVNPRDPSHATLPAQPSYDF
jgi:hypothetical protein